MHVDNESIKRVTGISKRYSSREIIGILKKDGWILADVDGDHHHFKHPGKKGKITVPHPVKNVHPKISTNILKQAGLHPSSNERK